MMTKDQNEQLLSRGANGVRWLLSVLMIMLAIQKGLFIKDHGFEVYMVFVRLAGFPEIFKYYGVAAILIEVLFAVGVWYKASFKSASYALMVLVVLGVVLSLYSIIFKNMSDCGCGLLGDNELFILGQKIILGSLLVYLIKKEDRLGW